MHITSPPQVGITPLTEWELLQVSGVDAKTFLQGQLSCDVNAATQQQTLLGCYCNLQGRMQAAFRLFRRQDDFLLLLPTGMASVLQTALQKYAIFSKVTLTSNPTDLALLASTGLTLDQIPTASAVQIVSLPEDPQRLLWVGTVDAMTTLQTNLSHPLDSLPATHWRLRDIMHGIANVFPTTQAQWLPHRVNYHLVGGISFTKGCFLGQEIIARLHYKGQLKHHAYRVRLHGGQPVAAGISITHATTQSPMGSVIDSVLESDQSTQQALVLLPANHGHPATLTLEEQTVAIDWLSLPYALTAN